MKNKYITNGWFLLPAMLISSLCSCKKDGFLNVPPKGSLTDQVTFSSEANADLFVNDVYNQLPNGNDDYEHLDQYTDNSDVGATNMQGQRIIRSNSLTPNSVPSGPGGMLKWDQNYNNIRKCNVFITQATKNKANFSDAWYKQRVGEVTYLRALFYTFLYTNYGGVPLISKPLDNTVDSGTNLRVPRSTADQTLAFIEADCDAAAAVLPATTRSNDFGRATSAAAVTLKGWVELFAASPLSNPGNDPTKWTKAAATNLQMINNFTDYGLFTGDGKDSYWTQFLARNNWNRETIFAKGYANPNSGHRLEGLMGPTIVRGTEEAWGNFIPTQNLVDDYEMDNGLPITDPASGYDPQHPYDHREQRFYQTIVYDGSYWQGDIFQSRTGGNNQIDLGSGSDISNTGYNARKRLDSANNGQVALNLHNGTSNYIFFRYAEVLLNYAEAQNEAAGPDLSVYDAVGKVRARAGFTATPLPAGLTKDQMRTVIRRERRVEFAFEDKRWYDIRRWDITAGISGVLNNPEYGMQITIGGPGQLIYTPVIVFRNKFSEFMNWLPIPQNARDQNPNLTQNDGYN
ncbi:RagB/SusD family nutrient uptake outer membrane protein [Flavitalea flava]